MIEEKKMIESERRFLLKKIPSEEVNISNASKMIACYLTEGFDPCIRVRLEGPTFNSEGETKAFLTIKGPKNEFGSGMEIENPIPVEHAEELLEKYPSMRIEKFRVKYEGFEIDFFTGKLDGLAIVELEGDEEELKKFVPPSWIGREITGDHRFSNYALSMFEGSVADLKNEVE
jgi:adenylate cyclase